MKDKVSGYLMLGMLHLGARSGYAIKKVADLSIRYVWPTSLAQVYPLLASLESEGKVARSDDPHGARARASYALTDNGIAALRDWVCSFKPKDVPLQLRDEGFLRLLFADAVSVDEQLTLIRQLRQRSECYEGFIRSLTVSYASELEAAGLKFPAIVAALGADHHRYTVQLLTNLESQLKAAAASDAAKG